MKYKTTFILVFIFMLGLIFIISDKDSYACDNCGGRSVGATWCEGTTQKRCVSNSGTRICNGGPGCSGCNCVGPCNGSNQCSEPDPSCPASNGANQNTTNSGTCSSGPTPTPTPLPLGTIQGTLSCLNGGRIHDSNPVRIFIKDSAQNVEGTANVGCGGAGWCSSRAYTIANFDLTIGTYYAVRAGINPNNNTTDHDPLYHGQLRLWVGVPVQERYVRLPQFRVQRSVDLIFSRQRRP